MFWLLCLLGLLGLLGLVGFSSFRVKVRVCVWASIVSLLFYGQGWIIVFNLSGSSTGLVCSGLDWSGLV